MDFIGSEEEAKLQIWYEKARASYKKSDTDRWEAARWCAKVVGKYKKGATGSLATYMSVSPDTVENLAHAYKIYNELCSKHEFRKPTRMARDMPTIYYSHFCALYKAREHYKMTLAETFDVLRDIYLSEGTISSRDVDGYIRDRYGKVKDWRHYGERVMKAQASMHKSHDLPKEGRELSYALFNWLGENIKGDE